MKTTLNRIKEYSPCPEGWSKLLTYLNKTEADDEPLDLLTILESNGVEDCLWAFKCTDNHNIIYRHIAADFAESVLHIYESDYPNDNRPRLAIQAARDYANGKIDDDAWGAARGAARDAAWDADSDAARAAAWAARAAARDYASDAAVAARDAAWAARAATWADARDAANDAARAATRAAAWAASDATWADARTTAEDARDAASDAELEKQKAIIIKWLS